MNMVNIVNAIINDGLSEYANTIPTATRDNITEVGNAILEYSPVTNKFLSTLMNKIVMSVINSKIYENPLSVLKKGDVPLGGDIEEIFVNMAKAEPYSDTATDLLSQKKPDVKVLYQRLNRQDKFPVSITQDRLKQAFTSYGALENLVTGIINSLYSGDNYSEFILSKNLLADAAKRNHVRNVAVPVMVNQTVNGTSYSAVANAASDFVMAVRTACSAFTFASPNFNKFAQLNNDPKPVMTWTPREDQILIIRADIATKIDVEVLAQAFNMSKTDLLAKTLEVDNFGDASNIYAMLVDKSFTKIYDNLFRMEEFFDPNTITWKYFLHHWQTYSISLFANAVTFGFIVPGDIYAFDSIPAVDAGKVGAVKYANAAAVQAVLPANVYANDGACEVPVASWTNTDTYNAGVAGSYTFTAVLGALPSGWTNTGSKGISVEVVVSA